MKMHNAIVVLVVAAFAVVAQAGVTETFESGFADGQDLVGAGDWIAYVDGGNTVHSSIKVSDTGGVGNSFGLASPSTAGHAAAIPLDPNDVPANGTFVLSSLINVSGNGSTGGFFGVNDGGGAGGFFITANFKPNVAELQFPGGAEGKVFENFGGMGWFQARMHITQVAGIVSAANFDWRDVDDTTAAGGVFSAMTAFDSATAPAAVGITHAHLESYNFNSGPVGRFDNFGPVIPEPASLALLGLGGLMLVRRRRAA